MCLGSMRASAALMRGAEQAFFEGDVLLVGVPHEDQPLFGCGGLGGACVVVPFGAAGGYAP